MKTITLFLTLIISILLCGCTNDGDKDQAVNPIIGDISFIKKFGYRPDATTDEVLRIKTHIEYVENVLRSKDVSTLSPTLQHKRTDLLDLLREYRTAGIFPKNYDYPGERKPCFIDKDHAICAVGFLIEKTVGRQMAELINSKHKYDELLAMNNEYVDHWIFSSGLTKEECAMIQPSYIAPEDNSITPGYAASSSIFSGVNLSLNTINVIQISRGANRKTIGVIGLLTGSGQVALGTAMFPKKNPVRWSGTIYRNENRRILSMVNIGLGTSTIILSAWNLITNRKPKDKSTAWRVYTLPGHQNKIGIAASFTRRF
jgi:hypothetical protein